MITRKRREIQKDKFNAKKKKFELVNIKNKIKAKPITDPDVERVYDFDNFEDLDAIYDMTFEHNLNQELADLLTSCNEFNNNNDQAYLVNNYNQAMQNYLDTRVNIQKIIKHINDKEFSAAVVRDIAPQFYLDKIGNNKMITNGDSNENITVEEID